MVRFANWFVPVALMLWPVITALLFLRLRPAVATLVSLLGALMFLPERYTFDGPGMPPLGKESISYLATLAGCLWFASRKLIAARPGLGLEALVLVLAAAGFVTALDNTDYLYFGPREVRRLSAWDGVSMAIRNMIGYGIPFFLGRALYRSRQDFRLLVSALVAAGLVYSLFVIWEIRMSPHLHEYTYGFHQNPYRFVARSIGYRPMVYMESGIAVGLFMGSTAFAAGAMARARIRWLGIPTLPIALYLFLMLLLCQSVAAAVYGLLLMPLLLTLNARVIAIVTLAITALTISYPALRAYDLFPREALTEVAYQLDPDRGESLEFRFDNEELLLERAREKLVFGWGRGGRNRVFDAYDGSDISVTDGFWILIMGSRGLIGWFVPFALILIPAVRGCVNLPRIPRRSDRYLVAGVSLLLAVRALDMLPNGFYTSFVLVISGGLHGAIPALMARRTPDPRPAHDPPTPEPAKPDAPTLSALLTGSRASSDRE